MRYSVSYKIISCSTELREKNLARIIMIEMPVRTEFLVANLLADELYTVLAFEADLWHFDKPNHSKSGCTFCVCTFSLPWLPYQLWEIIASLLPKVMVLGSKPSIMKQKVGFLRGHMIIKPGMTFYIMHTEGRRNSVWMCVLVANVVGINSEPKM